MAQVIFSGRNFSILPSRLRMTSNMGRGLHLWWNRCDPRGRPVALPARKIDAPPGRPAKGRKRIVRPAPREEEILKRRRGEGDTGRVSARIPGTAAEPGEGQEACFSDVMRQAPRCGPL